MRLSLFFPFTVSFVHCFKKQKLSASRSRSPTRFPITFTWLHLPSAPRPVSKLITITDWPPQTVMNLLAVTLLAASIGTAASASCGSSGIPFRFEVLPSGKPVLGCGSPTCFGAENGGRDLRHDSSFMVRFLILRRFSFWMVCTHNIIDHLIIRSKSSQTSSWIFCLQTCRLMFPMKCDWSRELISG